MDYDTINLLGLQPDLVQELNIIRIDDVININLTLKKIDYVCPGRKRLLQKKNIPFYF